MRSSGPFRASSRSPATTLKRSTGCASERRSRFAPRRALKV
jgi:hypothetical protein